MEAVAPSPRTPQRVGPAALVALGALALSASSVLISLAGTDTATTAFWRCTLALPALAPFLAAEVRRHGRPDARTITAGLLGGAFLGLDFVLWNVSIADVGAGIATVLVNMQVVFFPFAMRLLGGVRLARRFVLALPVLLAAVALTGGVIGPEPVGRDPLRGTGLALAAALGYTGYLYFARRSTVRAPQYSVAPVFLASTSAALVAAVTGAATTGVRVDLDARAWTALALVALSGQALGWLLISRGLPRLAPAASSTLLLLQPVGAEVLAVVVLGEIPTGFQVAGSAIVLAAVWALSRKEAAPAEPGHDRGPDQGSDHGPDQGSDQGSGRESGPAPRASAVE